MGWITTAVPLMSVHALIVATPEKTATNVRAITITIGGGCLEWVILLHFHNIFTAVCSNCELPRLCVAPETCECTGGLTGPTCQDGKS